MPTPTFSTSTNGGGTGSTGAATWSSYTPAAGEMLVAMLWSTRATSGVSTISASGWSLIDRKDLTVTGSLTFTAAFYERTATGTSSDDFNPTVGAAFYAVVSGVQRNWNSVAIALSDVVGAKSAAYATSTNAEGGSTTLAPPTINPDRATSLGVELHARRSTGGQYVTANGWTSFSAEVPGRNQGGGGGYKAVGAGSQTMPTVAVSNASAVALSFAVSGIPGGPGSATVPDWGVDRIAW